MMRGSVWALGLAAWVAMGGCLPAWRAQAQLEEPGDPLGSYLERLKLNRLRTEHLARRVAEADSASKPALATQLAKLYVAMLNEGGSDAEREVWESRGRDLLHEIDGVPGADTLELRLSLNRAVYARAEEAAERYRLRLAPQGEAQSSERQMRELADDFRRIAAAADAEVRRLEDAQAKGTDSEEAKARLADQRRVRSLSYYFAGWCHYYISFLSGSNAQADEALRCFGWLLGSPGNQEPTILKLPKQLLKYEHVARAAVGASLAFARRGNEGLAKEWMNAVDTFQELSPVVREQLVARQITMFVEVKDWHRVERTVRLAREGKLPGGGSTAGGPQPLTVAQARLLAVLTLEADRRLAGPAIEPLTQIALGDLAARQEVGQVLDLVKRYGTAPIGDSGFIVHYVRGLVQYDAAREAHRAADPAAEEPATAEATINMYRDALALLGRSLKEPDASTFGVERVRASMMLGRCAFFAGDLAEAGEHFASAWELGNQVKGSDAGEEALWLAILSFDRATKKTGADVSKCQQRREELASLFMQTFPDSARTARVVLLQGTGGTDGVSDEQALRVLMQVEKTSPVYLSARRQAARMLYAQLSESKGQSRELALLRFVELSEELLAIDRDAAMAGARTDGEATERLVTRCRQLLDALLGGPSPNADRAESVLNLLEEVARANARDLTEFRPEITYRQVQIALARNQEARATEFADRLAGMDEKAKAFGNAADRAIYRRLSTRWKNGETADASAAAADAALIVKVGRRVIEQFGDDAAAMGNPAVQSLYAVVAKAATMQALGGKDATIESPIVDRPALDLAVALDTKLLTAQPLSEEPLRRLAINAELAGDRAKAMECWRVLFSASATGTPAWFEARYQSLRLLAESDAVQARQLLAQHKVLYADFGPAPWGEKLRALEAALGPGPAPASSGGGAP